MRQNIRKSKIRAALIKSIFPFCGMIIGALIGLIPCCYNRDKLKVLEFNIDMHTCYIDSTLSIDWKVEGGDVFLQYANTRKKVNRLGSETITVRDSLLSYDGRFYIELVAKKKSDSIIASHNIIIKEIPPGKIRVQPPMVVYPISPKPKPILPDLKVTKACGVITDQNGMGIPGISVKADNSSQTITDSSGYFELDIHREVKSGLVPLYFSGGGYENLRIICSTTNPNHIQYRKNE